MLGNQTRDAICSHVARILREEREKRGISMTLLAQKAGLSQGMISLVEHEHRNPTLETMLRISEALDINLGDVIKQAYKATEAK